MGRDKRSVCLQSANVAGQCVRVPPDLWAPLDHTAVWTDCNTAIHNVVGPVRPTKQNRESYAEAKAHLERRYATQKLSVDQQVHRHMAIAQFQHQAGIDKVGPKQR